jgi:hypothetical protein
MAAQDHVGEELAYPSMAAAIMAAALATLLGATIGEILVDRNVVEVSLREWLPFLLPFFYLLPDWAREAPWVLAALGAVAVVTVRLLAGSLPRAALYLLIVSIICVGLLLGLQMRIPASADDWAFIGYVVVIGFLGGAPRPYRAEA